jgi:hypothetical protein
MIQELSKTMISQAKSEIKLLIESFKQCSTLHSIAEKKNFDKLRADIDGCLRPV